MGGRPRRTRTLEPISYAETTANDFLANASREGSKAESRYLSSVRLPSASYVRKSSKRRLSVGSASEDEFDKENVGYKVRKTDTNKENQKKSAKTSTTADSTQSTQVNGKHTTSLAVGKGLSKRLPNDNSGSKKVKKKAVQQVKDDILDGDFQRPARTTIDINESPLDQEPAPSLKNKKEKTKRQQKYVAPSPCTNTSTYTKANPKPRSKPKTKASTSMVQNAKPLSSKLPSSADVRVTKGVNMDNMVTAKSDSATIWAKYRELMMLRTTDAEDNCNVMRERLEELRKVNASTISKLKEENERLRKSVNTQSEELQMSKKNSESSQQSMENLEAKLKSSQEETAKINKDLTTSESTINTLKTEIAVFAKEQKRLIAEAKKAEKETKGVNFKESKENSRLHKTITQQKEEICEITQNVQLIATERDGLYVEMKELKTENKKLQKELKKSAGSSTQQLEKALKEIDTLRGLMQTDQEVLQIYGELTGIVISEGYGPMRSCNCTLTQKNGQPMSFSLSWRSDENTIEYTPNESNVYGDSVQDYLQEEFDFENKMLQKFFITLTKCA
eukprot:CFRG1382T1